MRLFGTNGIREVVGEKLTPTFVAAVAEAIGRTVPAGGPIVVGWDGRTSSPALARVVSGTLAASGHRVVEVGLLPTPAIQYSVSALGAALGVIVTASHNPPPFNGLKCIAADGMEVDRSVEEAIEADVAERRTGTAPYDRLGEIRTDPYGADRYIEAIRRCVDAEAIARRRFRVVLDCGNGASAATSPALLRRLGCSVVTLNAQVDGTFPGHLSEPTEGNLSDLRRAVPALGADLGIAHDGDADRAVFVDGSGRYISGERTLTLLAAEAVRRNRGGVVVTPVTATLAVEDAVTPLGGQVVYTRVGSPVVSREMSRRNAVFGGEENGGLIFPELQLARDGAMTAAKVLDLLARRSVDLAGALQGLPEYRLLREKIECPVSARAAVMELLATESETAGEHPITLDGLKIAGPDGWFLVRPSGTEPLIRVFAEAREPVRAEALMAEGLRRVRAAMAAVTPAR